MNSDQVNIVFLNQSKGRQQQLLPKMPQRDVRPSMFLNNLEFFPTIDLSQPNSVNSNMKRKNGLINLPPLFEDPISKSAINLKKNHNHSHSQPLIVQTVENAPNTQSMKNLDYVGLSKRESKHIIFRNSIVVINFDLGTQRKEKMDGSVKPLTRIKRQGTIFNKKQQQ